MKNLENDILNDIMDIFDLQADPEQSPRVQKFISKLPWASLYKTAPTILYLNGTTIWKSSNKVFWRWLVIGHDARRILYSIKYDDGDFEELTHNQVKRFLKSPILDSISQHYQVKKEYWTAQQSGCCQSPWIKTLHFTKKYTLAVKLIATKSSWCVVYDFTSNTYYYK